MELDVYGMQLKRTIEDLRESGMIEPDENEALTREVMSRVADEVRAEVSRNGGSALQTRIREGLMWAAEQLGEQEDVRRSR